MPSGVMNSHPRTSNNNGAGGNRTPVPKQSVDGLYACSPLFDLDIKDGNGHPSYQSSNQ